MQHVHDSPKVNVWWGIMSDGIVGPCFFHESTTMSAVYLDVLENFVFPQIVAEADAVIFQQDDAPAHFCAIVWTAVDDFLVDGSAGEGRLIGPHGVLTYH
jgi:hypothetical protein